MNPDHLAKVQEVTAQYHELVDAVMLNPHDKLMVATKCERLLSTALDAFAYDVDSVTPEETAQAMRRITTREDSIQELTQEGLTPFSCPLTVEELMEVSPALIPLMLARACVSSNFHSMHVNFSQVTSWRKFVQLYARKLPSV
jgi:hypothetical protein